MQSSSVIFTNPQDNENCSYLSPSQEIRAKQANLKSNGYITSAYLDLHQNKEKNTVIAPLHAPSQAATALISDTNHFQTLPILHPTNTTHKRVKKRGKADKKTKEEKEEAEEEEEEEEEEKEEEEEEEEDEEDETKEEQRECASKLFNKTVK
ncbi:hypothetical protein ElyMa_005405500 [Elysia marginata]|uniref:Uncharacterized protein n=1 Tax=Elysia marginata TaxID=1093978 RepID=A0AAV4EIB6_9GAST|nr:hypothetical protein ElyMa_005405500 [Elysia marginata]